MNFDDITTRAFRERIVELLKISGMEKEELINFIIPHKLYKYSRVNKYILDDLETGRITTSSVLNFNDVFDSRMHTNIRGFEEKERPGIELVSQVLGHNLTAVEIESELNRRKIKKAYYQRIAFNRISTELRIYCLSRRNDSNLMWSHYAQSHRGICIEYDFNEIHPNKKGQENLFKKLLFPVIYRNEPFDVTELKKRINGLDIELAHFCSSIVKSCDWSYENEWRVLYPHPFANNYEPLRFHINLNLKPKCIYLGSQFAYGLSDLRKDNNYMLTEEKEANESEWLSTINRLIEFAENNMIPLKLLTPRIGTFKYDFIELSTAKLKLWINKYYKKSRNNYHLITVINEALVDCKN